jgi:hypothetical protein
VINQPANPIKQSLVQSIATFSQKQSVKPE